MTLTNNAAYRVRNLAFGKYIKGSTTSPFPLGHYTYNANDATFNFTAVGVILITEQFYKLKTAANKFWTVPESGSGQLTLEDELSTTANAFYRQLFQLIDVSNGVVMLAPRSAPNSRVQLAGPLVEEGRYIQLFSVQVNQPQEQFAFELVSSAGTVEVPAIRQPVYSHHEKIYVENVEAGAGIQLYRNGQAYGYQRFNNSAGVATLEVDVTGLLKGDNLTADAFKTGETPSTSAVTKVQEAAGIVRVRETNGTVTYNVEILNIVSGSNSDTANAQRFGTPKVLASGLSLAAAESFRANANYVKAQL